MGRGAIGGTILAAAILFVLAGCTPSTQELPPPPGTRITTIPQADGDGADLAVDRAGGLHVTWARGAPGKDSTFYQFSPDGGETWSNPTFVGPKSLGRIFAGDSTLHFVTMYGIHHFSSHDHGRTWSECDPLIGVVYGGSDEFDGCCFGDTLVLAYLEDDFRDSLACMKVARFVGDKEIGRQVIARIRYHGISFHQPRLCESDGRLWLVGNITSSIDDVAKEGGGLDHSLRGSMVIPIWSSSDHGIHWTSIPGTQIEGFPIPSLAVKTSSKGMPLLAIAKSGIWIHAKQANGWTPQCCISTNSPAWDFGGPYRRLDAATRGNLAVIAWIDERHNWGDWNWRGFFMNPDDAKYIGMSYRNNDVFVVVDQNDFSVAPKAIRLTKEPALAGCLRVAIRRRELLVLWPGLFQVGRNTDAYGASPHVFLARIPLDSLATN